MGNSSAPIVEGAMQMSELLKISGSLGTLGAVESSIYIVGLPR